MSDTERYKSEASKAGAALGSIRTEKKAQASRVSLTEARKRLSDPDVRQVLSDKQQARRERERQAKEAAAALTPPAEKKRPGRPRTRPEVETVETGEKRGRGRPKKQDAQIPVEVAASAENGTGEAQKA